MDCPEPGLLPENTNAVALFAACNTQWRYAFSGVRTGLDYAGVEAAIRLHGFEPDSELFAQLQTLERALIDVDAEKHANENRRT